MDSKKICIGGAILAGAAIVGYLAYNHWKGSKSPAKEETKAEKQNCAAEPPKNEKAPIIVCVTGAAGQIGYSLIPLIASGDIFGKDQPIHLRLLDIPQVMENLKGTCMEIEDCAYPVILSVTPTSDYKEAFTNIDVGIFLGGFPRKEGMERKELMSKNCGIFKGQGEVLNEVAKPTSKIIAVNINS